MSQKKSYKSYQGKKPNFVYAILGVTFVLVLLGLFGLIILNGQELIKYLKEQVQIIVEIKNEVNDEELTALQDHISSKVYYKIGSMQYITKEEAVMSMKEELGEEFLKLDMPNPLYDIITFNVNAAFLRPDSLSNIQRELKSKIQVSDVYYQENIVADIDKNMENITVMAAGIGLLLILFSSFLIHNTIRLALYSNRFLIKNMELVGATWSFISKPYLRKSMKHGMISGIAAIIILAILFYLALMQIPQLGLLINIENYIALGAGIISLGLLINIFSTWFVVSKYLRMRVDDMY